MSITGCLWRLQDDWAQPALYSWISGLQGDWIYEDVVWKCQGEKPQIYSTGLWIWQYMGKIEKFANFLIHEFSFSWYLNFHQFHWIFCFRKLIVQAGLYLLILHNVHSTRYNLIFNNTCVHMKIFILIHVYTWKSQIDNYGLCAFWSKKYLKFCNISLELK